MSEAEGLPMSSLFCAIADYAGARGVRGPGVIDFDGPDGLTCKLNATPEEHDGLPPFSVALHIRGGWPIAVIDPRGGTVLQISEWNEDKLIKAFRRAALSNPDGKEEQG